ncbi:hypothetical protein ALP02_05149 [Pseudomonas coronafaciens pv. garcae]|nr:hypothetical protein ALP02_05149 [Pseudomonas coronafaciens pv. garcae]
MAMTAKSVERDVAISELADHLESDLMPCPAGRTALLTWIEKKACSNSAQSCTHSS